MKNFTNRFILFGLCLTGFFTAYAYDFYTDGLYYNILSETDRTVEITYRSATPDNNRIYVSGEITIPKKLIYNSKTYTVTAIGEGTFNDCIKLTSVSIPNSVTSIGDAAFFNCCGLTSVSIPNSVTSIGTYAFYSCRGLTSVSISNSVTSIGKATFRYCSGLTSVSIPNSVTSIGYEAFYGCSGLTSISIGDSVTSIGNYAFGSCENLQNIYCMPTTPPKYYSSFSRGNYMNATLYVPVGSISAYDKVDPWRNFWCIKEYDFSGVDDITVDDYSDYPVEIYNLSGNKVESSKENLAPGIYIMRQGRKVEKIMIR